MDGELIDWYIREANSSVILNVFYLSFKSTAIEKTASGQDVGKNQTNFFFRPNYSWDGRQLWPIRVKGILQILPPGWCDAAL